MTTIEDFNSLQLPWESLEAIVTGISAIDLTTMPIRDRDEAHQFILSYGYDMNRARDAAEVKALYREAINFINTRLLSDSDQWVLMGEYPSPANAIPERVIESDDVMDLLVLASQGNGEDGFWACAILKVMHTLSHIENGPYYRQFLQARDQILSRFEDLVSVQDDGTAQLRQSEDSYLRLKGFEAKSRKTRESILVKMLCKRENVAENINDLIGVRFITRTPAEAVMVVQILREQKVILFPNIIPSRSRNTLIDFNKFRGAYDAVLKDIEGGKKSIAELEELFTEFRMIPQDGFDEFNPSSSPDYRSLHITCRQLIRIPDPETGSENRFFIPYEIQITDQQNYLDSRHGSSAHQVYKQKQFASARRRVLGPLLLEATRNKKPVSDLSSTP